MASIGSKLVMHAQQALEAASSFSSLHDQRDHMHQLFEELCSTQPEATEKGKKQRLVSSINESHLAAAFPSYSPSCFDREGKTPASASGSSSSSSSSNIRSAFGIIQRRLSLTTDSPFVAEKFDEQSQKQPLPPFSSSIFHYLTSTPEKPFYIEIAADLASHPSLGENLQGTLLKLATNTHFPLIYALLCFLWIFSNRNDMPASPSPSSSSSSSSHHQGGTITRLNIFLKGANGLFSSDLENDTQLFKPIFQFLKGLLFRVATQCASTPLSNSPIPEKIAHVHWNDGHCILPSNGIAEDLLCLICRYHHHYECTIHGHVAPHGESEFEAHFCKCEKFVNEMSDRYDVQSRDTKDIPHDILDSVLESITRKPPSTIIVNEELDMEKKREEKSDRMDIFSRRRSIEQLLEVPSTPMSSLRSNGREEELELSRSGSRSLTSPSASGPLDELAEPELSSILGEPLPTPSSASISSSSPSLLFSLPASSIGLEKREQAEEQQQPQPQQQQETQKPRISLPIVDLLFREWILQLSTAESDSIRIFYLKAFAGASSLVTSVRFDTRVRLQTLLYQLTRPGGPLYASRPVRHEARLTLDAVFPTAKWIRRLVNSSFRLFHQWSWPKSVALWALESASNILSKFLPRSLRDWNSGSSPAEPVE